MKKKVISVLLAAVMVTGLVAGCGSGGGSGNGGDGSEQTGGGGEYDGVELTYWSMWSNTEPQGQALQEAVDAWEAETGATVNIEWKGREIKDILSSSLEAQEPFDLFEDDYNRIAVNLKDYVADLTDMAAAANYAENSFAVFNDKATEWAGFLPCVTEQPQVGGVYYNMDLFEKAGVEVPTTWAEFLDVCAALKENDIQPLALDSAYAAFLFGYHISRYIGEEAVADLAVNGGWSGNASVAQAAQDMIDFVKAGYLADGAPAEYPASQNAMGLNGDVAMVVCANYVTAEVNNNTQSELNWGVFSYPSVEGGIDATGVEYAGANSIAITKYSENQQAAFDLAMYIVTGEQDQNMADTANQMPADPNNTVPSSQNGTQELLNATTTPLTWNMGLNQNGDLQASIRDIVIQLFEGKYATGADFAAALDALY
ncbi:ABC transporter substrate-binding protein [Lachnoclostridium sp. An169]|uniref:ABC transporter substrate-binding protein n=1 Tax=Lachnoclostridium sp. An169 TaxID=1965569 RepID=UPI000B37E68C|nr:extracellular solute-binding protein [Lachnoclostridium sp. An169]OUP81475.1 ABC transporter substrate-binding protein [Lachnoclostridium sp. An169]